MSNVSSHSQPAHTSSSSSVPVCSPAPPRLYSKQRAAKRATHPSLVCASASVDPQQTAPPAVELGSKDVSTSPLWEIDFCSRPLLDERGKKVWELLICDPERNFEYSEYFPNSKINSAEVRVALLIAR